MELCGEEDRLIQIGSLGMDIGDSDLPTSLCLIPTREEAVHPSLCLYGVLQR
jgi:hypothetical protein